MSDSKAAPISLVTGGAGFIGTNLALRLIAEGHRVLLFDDLSRPGVEANLRWLCERHPDHVEAIIADILDPYAVRSAVNRADEVYHLAAQVAVTTSLESPLRDFDVNTRGTLNLLEALRARRHPPPLLYASTSKVYGALEDIPLERRERRYMPLDPIVRHNGIDERRPLDFHGPYGCSKGAADQYVLDHARCFGLRTVVLRMSCIYGPHQCGSEDQGWVAHFMIRGLDHQPITIFGDGRQVRDILYVDDLVSAMRAAMQNIGRLAGHAFNIGGGPSHTVSLLELLDLIGRRYGLCPPRHFRPWRRGDPLYYVTNPARFSALTQWRPRTSVEQGIDGLYQWLCTTRPGPPVPAPLARAASQ